MKIRPILTLLCLFCIVSSLSAQTVESVLRAMQQRQMMIYTRLHHLDWPNEYYWLDWGNNIPTYPSDGTITKVADVVKVLNKASGYFDQLKTEFIAFDEENKTCVNVRHYYHGSADGGIYYESGNVVYGGAGNNHTEFELRPIRLPSIGEVNELNWREKLRQLASNVDQLRAMRWPAKTHHVLGGFNWFNMQDPQEEPPDHDTRYEHSIDLAVNFPFIGPAPDGYPDKETVTVYPGWKLTSGVLPYPWETPTLFHWDLNGWALDVNGSPGMDSDTNGDGIWERQEVEDDEGLLAYLDNGFSGGFNMWFSTGLEMSVNLIKQLNGGGGITPLPAKFYAYKAPVVSPFGDLTEILALNGSLNLNLGNLTLLAPEVEQTSPAMTRSIGDFATQDAELLSTALDTASTFLNFGSIQITGTLIPVSNGDTIAQVILDHSQWDGEDPPSPVASETAYTFALTDEPQWRKGNLPWSHYDPTEENPTTIPPWDSQHQFNVGGIFVAVPAFPDCLPAPAKRVAPRKHMPGEVEPTIALRDMVRIHLGQGKEDLNQEAWLTPRPDGFGTMLFSGSARQFEVLYEDDPQAYGDMPIGGRLFDSSVRFTELQAEKSGWIERFAYICEWFTPRLRQVKGGDVLVDITYNDAYTKTLKFYWLADVGTKSGKFYSVSNPFKEVVINNPKAGDGTLLGMPNVKEQGYHLDVTENGMRLYRISLRGKDSTEEKFRVETKPAANPGGTATYYTEIVIARIADEFGNLDMQPWEITTVNDGVTLRSTVGYDADPINYEYEVPNYVETWSATDPLGTPKRRVERSYEANQIIYTSTGPDTWAGSGSGTKWTSDWMLVEQKSKVQGKTFTVTNSWSDNVCNSVSALNGVAFSTSTTTYDSLRHWQTITDGGPPKTTKLRQANSITEVPWSLEEIEYPGNYRAKHSLTTTDTEVTSEVTDGWGDPPVNGSVTTTKTKLNGGFISRKVTMSGVEVEKAETSPNQATKWGAPKEIKLLQGETVKYEYEETGANWGVVKKITDPFTVASTFATRDWLGRTTTWTNTHGESFTSDYSDPLKSKVNLSDGKFDEKTFNPFGEVRGSKSKFGVVSETIYSPESGTASVTIDGRTKSGVVDQYGTVTRMLQGLGSRGQAATFGVGAGMLYTEVTPLQSGGGEMTKIRTYYDAQGRVKQINRPSHDGGAGQITETWVYDDANRKVTHFPAPGPVLNTTITTLSSDGATTTVNVGGYDLYRTTRSIVGGKITEITELNNDSETGSSQWQQVSRTEITPKTGTNARETVTTPWNMATRALKVVEPMPSALCNTSIFEGSRQTLSQWRMYGLPYTLSGSPDGRNINLSTTRTKGRVSAASGTVGGQTVSFNTDANWKLSQVVTPGSVKNLTYSQAGGGYGVTVQDSAQLTQNEFEVNAVGDFVKKIGDGDINLWSSTADSATGRTSSFGVTAGALNTSINVNPYGQQMGKTYPGGFLESIARHPDGTIESRSVNSRQTNYSYGNNPDTVTADYSDDLVNKETFFKAGPRSKVEQTGAGQSESRDFKYSRLVMKEENHTNGPLAGWKVELLQDTMGRLETIRATKGTLSRTFTLGYDLYSRLQNSAATWPIQPVTATYGRNAAGLVNSLTRRTQTTTWNYDTTNNRLLGVTNGSTTPFYYTYSYSPTESRHRIGARIAGIGTSWRSLSYDAQDRLRAVILANSTTRFYGYDDRNNRTDQGAAIALAPNPLNQITNRTLTSRGFGVMGSVYPGAQAEFYHNLNPNWVDLTASTTDGSFFRWYDVDVGLNAGGAVRVTGTVRGTRTDLPPGSGTSISTSPVNLLVPPALEEFLYDDEGRLKQDAYWVYKWDGKSRLTKMTRREPMPDEDMLGEEVVFAYDADGRRIKKSRVITYRASTLKPPLMETSTMLWARWQPLCETIEKGGHFAVRRWFQWGADASQGYEGAGGIGGLVAIHEEGQFGTPTRTLLPIQDGLGNITAVLDAADNKVVARYDFGPFGEPLGESGEVECCPFRWQTKYYDAESQHYYFGYRHYDPRFGRWLSRDPLGEAGGFNLYAYCGNDPVNRHDPLGLAGDGQHIIPQAIWQNGKVSKAVADIFDSEEFRITNDAYKYHNGKTLWGISHDTYSKEVQKELDAFLGGRSLESLTEVEARQFATGIKSAPKSSVIGKFNRAVKVEAWLSKKFGVDVLKSLRKKAVAAAALGQTKTELRKGLRGPLAAGEVIYSKRVKVKVRYSGLAKGAAGAIGLAFAANAYSQNGTEGLVGELLWGDPFFIRDASESIQGPDRVGPGLVVLPPDLDVDMEYNRETGIVPMDRLFEELYGTVDLAEESIYEIDRQIEQEALEDLLNKPLIPGF